MSDVVTSSNVGAKNKKSLEKFYQTRAEDEKGMTNEEALKRRKILSNLTADIISGFFKSFKTELTDVKLKHTTNMLCFLVMGGLPFAKEIFKQIDGASSIRDFAKVHFMWYYKPSGNLLRWNICCS